MTPDTQHSPTPEFRAHLEWELVRAYRREARIGARRADLWRRRMRIAAVILVSVAIGTATGIASAQITMRGRGAGILESANAELLIAQLRVETARKQLEEVSNRIRAGAVKSDAATPAELELRTMEAKATRARLNIEEIRATSMAPRDELNAPLVGGRDFVSERIALELGVAQQALVGAERALANADERVQMGAASALTRVEAHAEVKRAQSALAVLAERVALRREFLKSGTSAGRIAMRLTLVQLRQQLLVAQAESDLANQRLKTLQAQQAMGSATQLEAMRAQVDALERLEAISELQLRLMMLERAVGRDTTTAQ
jgi:hypothetical protein